MTLANVSRLRSCFTEGLLGSGNEDGQGRPYLASCGGSTEEEQGRQAAGMAPARSGWGWTGGRLSAGTNCRAPSTRYGLPRALGRCCLAGTWTDVITKEG